MTSKYTSSGFMDGRTYIIGRAGQIRIHDSSVSRSHAKITFVDGMIRIRDLCSTNGTFVEKGGKFVPCHEAYISPNTRLKIGAGAYSVKGLLAASGIYAISQDDTDFTIILSRPSRKTNLRHINSQI
ncbi:MAG: FHA domain-containing protein [Gammaproteobacteria bacterium]